MSSFALLLVAVVGGAGVIVGALFRWWGVLAPVGFTSS
jgi:hypothetical protein